MYIYDGEGSGSDGSGVNGNDHGDYNGDYNGGSGTAAEGGEGDAGAAKKKTRKETKKETDKGQARSRKKVLYCVQQAGDVIYVPEGFAHGTRHPPGGGRHGGVGIAFEFRQRDDAQACSVK